MMSDDTQNYVADLQAAQGDQGGFVDQLRAAQGGDQ